jgi:type I restriction enzyme R subunit
LFPQYLIKKLPVESGEMPVEVLQQVDMESYRIQPTGGDIELGGMSGQLDPQAIFESRTAPVGEEESLSGIITELNDHFGTNFTEDDKVFIRRLEETISADEGLAATFRVNTQENARLTFKHVVHKYIQDMYETNFKFYKEVTDNEKFADAFFGWLFDRYRDKFHELRP